MNPSRKIDGRKPRISLDMEFVAKAKHGVNIPRVHKDVGQHEPAHIEASDRTRNVLGKLGM